jgi:uncharacterized cupredoxin-like copper-binding protein/Cu/Ag efflux protein CusF
MKSRNLLLALPCALLSLSAMAAGSHAGNHDDGAIGKPGAVSKVTRTVAVDMKDDMRFHSSNFNVKQGETIRFVVKNSGKVKHEMVLGTQKDLKDHYEVMKKNPEMEHADANMVTVAPGKSGEIIWQFTKAGKVDFACLQPGHYDAGMKGLVNVSGGAVSDRTASSAVVTAAASDVKTTPLAASMDMSDGEIRKVDIGNKRITLKHGEIKNLDMPGMTMVFQVKDPAMLDKVKAGDKVRFTAEKNGGAIVVTDIQPAK